MLLWLNVVVFFLFAHTGQHYFLGLNETTDCNNLQGLFLLYHKGDLIGVGLIPFGSFQSSKKRVWFENPDKKAAAVSNYL